MYHYVYYSYEEWGRGYIGVRSCNCLPEEDCEYFGSYTDKTFKPTYKIILLTFETREEANQAEITLHAAFNVGRNPDFANKANARSYGFALPGPQSEEHTEKIRLAKIRHWADESARQKHLEALKLWRQNSPEKVREEIERLQRVNEFYKGNYEAALERGRNGIEKMKEYWEVHERSAHLRVPVQVKLPGGDYLAFKSRAEACKELNIPKSAFWKIEKGYIPEGSKWSGYSVIRMDTTEG